MSAHPAAEIRAIIISDDVLTIRLLTALFQEIGVTPQVVTSIEALSKELDRTKYEAFVLDFDSVLSPPTLIHYARSNPANSKALVFAIVSNPVARQQAIAHGANFVFERPILSEDIRIVLGTSCDLLIRERRRYFRCASELPVLLIERKTSVEVQCKTINVSRTGMAVLTPSTWALGTEVDVTLFLQRPAPTIQGRGVVVWDDKHGKSGISFSCLTTKMQADLDLWLDAHFARLLKPQHRAQWLSQ